MSELKNQIDEALAAVRGRTQIKPEAAIILGTGLGATIMEKMEIECAIPYKEIPHFAVSTVEFHKGELLLGKLGSKPVVAMRGRFHLYEGYSAGQVTFPVRVMKALGAETLFVSNACGGMNVRYRAGDLLVITDHINFMGCNPLVGQNDESLGPRFPDMSEPYSRDLIRRAEAIALKNGYRVHSGVYVAVVGPNLETAAEYRMFQRLGADVVGMSTVPETIVAIHAGMKVFGISVITDLCVPDTLKPAKIEEIIETANRSEPKIAHVIMELIEGLA